jgi:hypothetical protein
MTTTATTTMVVESNHRKLTSAFAESETRQNRAKRQELEVNIVVILCVKLTV